MAETKDLHLERVAGDAGELEILGKGNPFAMLVHENGVKNRVEVGVIGRHVLGEQWHDRDRPLRFSPFADLAHCLVDDP